MTTHEEKKPSVEDLIPQEISVMIDILDTGKPLLNKLIDKCKVYKEEFDIVKEFIADTNVDITNRIFKKFIEKGYTEENAIKCTAAIVMGGVIKTNRK